MTHSVLDGGGNLKYVLSLGTGDVSTPYRLITNTYDQALTELGNVFIHTDRHVVALNSSFIYLLKTPVSGTIAFTGLDIITTSAPLNVDIKEDAIVSANGTAETLRNLRRNSTTQTSALLYLSPTVTDEGVAITETIVAGDKNIGGNWRLNYSLILKPQTNYLVKVQNVSAASATIALSIQLQST